ncbi:MAG: M23 family metallopeptidase, partial [Bacteroidetes bacterium]|nr:M23 family metallopeptidase [Bacteroidota bacterium]
MTRVFLVVSAILLTAVGGYLVHHSASGEDGSGGGNELEAKEAARYDTSTTDWNDYLWPTDAGTVRTSDFAEFRATHLHAGIDVSTGGRTGFKVFASRDGWLHSAYFQPGGYGWFLVLRHADGYHTCYAHLDRYADKVADAYFGGLLKRKRSYGFLSFDRDTVRVRKGEVIAYTGATGAGPPHLHFEVRDPDFNPVNPGLSPHLRPLDSIPPEMKQLMLQPMDAASSIDGKHDVRLLNVAGSGDSWRVGGLPVLRGRVGVLLRAHDRANGATDYPTPYRIAMYVDGKEVFSATNNRFQDTLGFHIRIDRDHDLMKARKGEFRKLFREQGNLLETYWPRDADAGVLSAGRFGAGEKTVRIIAQDLEGNRSVLSMKVMIAADLRLEHESQGTQLSLHAAGDGTLLVLEEKGNKGWDAVAQWPWKEAVSGVAVDLKRYRASNIRAVGIDAFGNRTEFATWTPGPLKGSAGRLYPRREIVHDQIIYHLKTAAPFTAPPRVLLSQGEREVEGVVLPVSEFEYRAVLTAWPGFSGTGRIRVTYRMGEKEIEWSDSLTATLVSAAEGGQLRSDDGRFVMNFAPGDLHRSMLLTVARSGGDSVTGYLVAPEGQPVAGRPVISILPDPGMRTPVVTAAWPIKKYADMKLPHSAGARVGRYLGMYTLVDDTDGPKALLQISPRSREPVRISVTDSVSG